MFYATEEEKRILTEQKSYIPKLKINKFLHLSIRGIANELHVDLHRVVEAALKFFLTHYWQDSLDKKLNVIHEKNFHKEFMLDYCMWLIDNDERLYTYALNARKRKWYHENKERINEKKRNDPVVKEKVREYNARPEVIERKRVWQYKKYQENPEAAAKRRREARKKQNGN